MSKNRIVLFVVLGVAVGLALGVFGYKVFASQAEQKQMEREEAEIQAMMPGISEDAPQKSQELIAAEELVDDMQSLKSALMFFYGDVNMDNNLKGKKVDKIDLGKALDTPEHIKEALGEYVRNIDKYIDGNWIFRGTDVWWIGYNLETGFKDKASAIGKELKAKSDRMLSPLLKDMEGNPYDGGSMVYMKRELPQTFKFTL